MSLELNLIIAALIISCLCLALILGVDVYILRIVWPFRVLMKSGKKLVRMATRFLDEDTDARIERYEAYLRDLIADYSDWPTLSGLVNDATELLKYPSENVPTREPGT
jgi:hypothetical protein